MNWHTTIIFLRIENWDDDRYVRNVEIHSFYLLNGLWHYHIVCASHEVATTVLIEIAIISYLKLLVHHLFMGTDQHIMSDNG